MGPHARSATQIFRNKKQYAKPIKQPSQTGTHHLVFAEK